MRQLCKHCGSQRTCRRSKSRYCGYCYDHFYGQDFNLAMLPADHPFRKEREVRVQRMIERAAAGLPLFEEPG